MPQPSAMVIFFIPRFFKQRTTPRMNSTCVVRPTRPSSPRVLPGSRSPSKPHRFGLNSTGVSQRSFGITFSQMASPSSSGDLPWSTVTGDVSCFKRATCRLINAAPSTVPAPTTLGPASTVGPSSLAAETVSAELDGAAGAAGAMAPPPPRLPRAWQVRGPAQATCGTRRQLRRASARRAASSRNDTAVPGARPGARHSACSQRQPSDA